MNGCRSGTGVHGTISQPLLRSIKT